MGPSGGLSAARPGHPASPVGVGAGPLAQAYLFRVIHPGAPDEWAGPTSLGQWLTGPPCTVTGHRPGWGIPQMYYINILGTLMYYVNILGAQGKKCMRLRTQSPMAQPDQERVPWSPPPLWEEGPRNLSAPLVKSCRVKAPPTCACSPTYPSTLPPADWSLWLDGVMTTGFLYNRYLKAM
uniref:Uncharacterized protein n=1 Tax=Pipistrellus kuhlii TaxID=59472 RepID=A0A7J7ZJZ5_PIPKU|nr:hypothetical protein mPipKuh1_009574 [Pipistrellus kuhlii]